MEADQVWHPGCRSLQQARARLNWGKQKGTRTDRQTGQARSRQGQSTRTGEGQTIPPSSLPFPFALPAFCLPVACPSFSFCACLGVFLGCVGAWLGVCLVSGWATTQHQTLPLLLPSIPSSQHGIPTSQADIPSRRHFLRPSAFSLYLHFHLPFHLPLQQPS